VSDELTQYFKDMELLFGSPGWAHLTEQLEELEKSWSDIHRLNNNDQLQNAKGALIVIGTLLSLEEATRQSMEENDAETL